MIARVPPRTADPGGVAARVLAGALPCDQREQCALAATVGPQKGEDFAVPDVQADILERFEAVFCLFVAGAGFWPGSNHDAFADVWQLLPERFGDEWHEWMQ